MVNIHVIPSPIKIYEITLSLHLPASILEGQKIWSTFIKRQVHLAARKQLQNSVLNKILIHETNQLDWQVYLCLKPTSLIGRSQLRFGSLSIVLLQKSQIQC